MKEFLKRMFCRELTPADKVRKEGADYIIIHQWHNKRGVFAPSQPMALEEFIDNIGNRLEEKKRLG